MAFDIDIIVLYSERDNEISKTVNGWVSDFGRFLSHILYQISGEEYNILLKSEHDSITGANTKKVATLIPILSSSFFQSNKCEETLRNFNDHIDQPEVERIFKVLKSPLSQKDQPEYIRDLKNYEIFHSADNPEAFKEYGDFLNKKSDKEYWMKMLDLAYDINHSLNKLKKKKRSIIKSINTGTAIYLAETSSDLLVYKSIISRELQRHGYTVLPERNLPHDIHNLLKQIKNDIDKSAFAIHLIGKQYGKIPEGADRSVIEIQNQIAAEKSASSRNKKEFARLIWLASNMEQSSERQQAFVESIKRDIASNEGAEIIQTPIEDFKNIIREELFEVGLNKRDMPAKAGRAKKSSVYLMYDKVDQKNAETVKKLIEKSGYIVLEPSFKGEILDLRQQHINNLKYFDAAIIYKGTATHQWIRMKLLDLLKAPGYGRNKPMAGKAIISSEENSLSSFKDQDITLIQGDDKKIHTSVKEFLKNIED